MSLSLSYNDAAFNLGQILNFTKDSNQNEGRLGVWRFSHSVYYISSSDCKISRIWFDFLHFIGLIVDHNDPSFKVIKDSSAVVCDRLYSEFHKPGHDPDNVDLAAAKYTISVLQKENDDKSRQLKEYETKDKKQTDLQKSVKDLKSQLDTQKKQYEDKIQELNKKLDLKEPLHLLGHPHHPAATSLPKDEQHESKLRSDLLNEKRMHHTLQKKVEELEEKNKELSKQLISMQSDKKSHPQVDEKKLASLTSELGSVKAKIAEREEENLKLHQQLDQQKKNEVTQAPDHVEEKEKSSQLRRKSSNPIKRILSHTKKSTEKSDKSGEKSTEKSSEKSSDVVVEASIVADNKSTDAASTEG